MNSNSLYDHAYRSEICISFLKDRKFLADNKDILQQQLSSRRDLYDEPGICIEIL